MSVSGDLAIAGMAALLLIATHGGAYFWGKGAAERAHALEAAGDSVAGAGANAEVAGQVNEASGRLGQAGVRTATEAADARREIERYAAAAPAPGRVGGGALVDPGLSRDLLCRIERLRSIAEGPACRDAAAHRPVPGAADGRGV